MPWYQVTLPQADISHNPAEQLQSEFMSVCNPLVKVKGQWPQNVSLWAAGGIYAGLNQTQVYYLSFPASDPLVFQLIQAVAKKFNGVQCQKPDLSNGICMAGDRNSLEGLNKE
jgi:hypothetical protein